MAELKPCPFCGGEAEVFEYDPFNQYQGRFSFWGVHCLECGVEMIRGVSKEKIIETWNRRVDPVQANDYEIVLGGFHNG